MKAGTESKLKFKKLKRRLSLSHWQCMGILESIWQLTAQSAPEGDIGRFSDEDIAAAIEYDGDEAVLVSALVDCGWLDVCETYRLVVHDWHEHAPNYIKGNLKKHNEQFARATSPEHPAKEAAKQPAICTLPPSQAKPSLA